MRQRGRKSTASLSVVPISIDAQRPAPPSNLNKPQADLWRSIVADMPAGWFRSGDALLTMFCRHADTGNWLSKLIDAEPRDLANLQRLDRLLAMRARETQMVSSLATRMRLTQQARISPRSAGRAVDNAATGRKLWERD
jgi:hypothetical protein